MDLWHGAVIFGLIFLLFQMLWKKKVKYNGKHCLVTGGSKGLGKSIAIALAAKGAHVTILARNKKDLLIAKEEIEASRISETQKIITISCDVTSRECCEKALQQAKVEIGCVPEFVFLSAGISKPGLFLEQDPDEIRKTFDLNVMGVVNVANPASKMMVEDNTQGRIIIIGSVLGFFGLIGYSSYVPSKFALRGLAECLRLELEPKGIKVHLMFPATIYTPGFEEEQKIKPEITKTIEGTDEGQTPEVVANILLKGIDRDEFFITSEFIGELFRCTSTGAAPGNNFILDAIKGSVGKVALPLWRKYTEHLIRKH
jgi:3-dehydrosphinganine reductase